MLTPEFPLHVEAIVFDMDDTLLRDDRTISDYTIQTLREAHARGIRIIPASGRAKDSMTAFVRQIGMVDLFIAYNGAHVYSPDGQLLRAVSLDVDTAREVAAFAEKNELYAQTYRGGRFFYNREGAFAQEYARTSMLSGECVGDLEAFITEPTAKILMMDTAEKIQSLLPAARSQFDGRVSVTCSKPYFLEFNPQEATKGNALAYCAKALGFSLEKTLAFGDSLNDLSMLTLAGYGVAIGNARDDVKHALRYQADTNENDGVARFIHTNVLCGGNV